MRPLLHAALAVACLAAGLTLPTASRAAADPVKVAVIVGPVGSLTPTYLALAEAAAAEAEATGATVARAYSPNATPANVLAAVEDANVIVYFGHGYGHPSPYGELNPARQNGWALQGPRARGTHDDGLDGYLAYYGEDWIVANARPAPGFVMIYSNTCYAPGASEGGHAPATPRVAAERVAYYSRKVFRMGGSAYFATDFDRGAADLVGRILAHRDWRYGDLFAADHRFVPGALTTQPHLFSTGQQVWLHRSKYTEGPPNYWYAFAGNPDATPIRSWDPVAPTVTLVTPRPGGADVATSTVVELRFDERVVGVNRATLQLIGPEGKATPAAVTYDAGSGVARIQPKRALSMSAVYTVRVGADIRDLAGNALEPMAWRFTTRLDADAWPDEQPMVLADGSHRLIRLDEHGAIADEQELVLSSERRVLARTRARLPGAEGSWLEIAGGALAGWWVAESPQSFVPGPVEEVTLPVTEVAVPADAATSIDGSAAPGRARIIHVDARSVVEGRTYVRIAGSASSWIVAPASASLEAAGEQRIGEHRALPEPAELRIAGDDETAFRFDAAGRVAERRTLTAADGPIFETTGALRVNARWFHQLGGALDGWAVAAGDRVTVAVPENRDPS